MTLVASLDPRSVACSHLVIGRRGCSAFTLFYTIYTTIATLYDRYQGRYLISGTHHDHSAPRTGLFIWPAGSTSTR